MLTTLNSGYQANTLVVFQRLNLEISAGQETKEGGGGTAIMDKITLRQESASLLTYSSASPINGEREAGYRRLQDLVTDLLRQQGTATTVDIGDRTINVRILTPDRAQELVAEDGYFGVQQTSDRIVEFAKATAKGDSSRIDAIREGIDRGFEEAKKALGGWLPDISHATYDAVMDKLDHWVWEAKAAA